MVTCAKIIARDAAIDVRRRQVQAGIGHPSHLTILDDDGHVARDLGEHATQLFDVHLQHTLMIKYASWQ